MDIFSNLALGFQTALLLHNVAYCFVGVLLGTLIGVLPGVGPTAAIAMLLPATYALSPETSLIMLAGIYYGAQYGGSITAILINLPGEASSAVTALDGYQMARQGRAGPALTIAALGSFFAGSAATLLVAASALPLTTLALQFRSAEYFSLMVLGLITSIALAHGSFLKALAMIVLGLLLGLVGTDVYTSAPRFTFGIIELFDGVNFVAVAVGLFGVSEILRNLESEKSRVPSVSKIGSLWPSAEEFRRSSPAVLRGTVLGSLLGLLPGGGAIIASFASYAVEKRASKHPEQFGAGAVEGVAGPESANNAAAQTSFIPMLTLGIPANSVMALMIAAVIAQGIMPGPSVATQRPELFWGLIASMWIGNLMLVLINVPLVGLWIKLLRVPYYVLFPSILVFSSIGIYAINGNPVDLLSAALFGVVGYALLRLRCEPAPLLLGFILGPLLEEHFRRAMLVSRGEPMVFLTRPISAALLIVSLIILVGVLLPAIRGRRDEVFVEPE